VICLRLLLYMFVVVVVVVCVCVYADYHHVGGFCIAVGVVEYGVFFPNEVGVCGVVV
jgi:hypothetical protein